MTKKKGSIERTEDSRKRTEMQLKVMLEVAKVKHWMDEDFYSRLDTREGEEKRWEENFEKVMSEENVKEHKVIEEAVVVQEVIIC